MGIIGSYVMRTLPLRAVNINRRRASRHFHEMRTYQQRMIVK